MNYRTHKLEAVSIDSFGDVTHIFVKLLDSSYIETSIPGDNEIWVDIALHVI
jgi:hypothetical protein